MHGLVDLLKSVLSGNELVHLLTSKLAGWPLYAALSAIIFSETGLLVGFFLPGDSLLFAVGVICALGYLNVWLVMPILMIAAIVGDNTGYGLGRSTGPRIFSRTKSRFFNPDHIRRTREFYEKHGARAIIYARFVPIVRTCTPFVAGVANMRYPRFLFFSLFGGAGWITFMTLLGYKLGSFRIVQQNLERVILLIVLLSLAPAVIELLRSRRRVPSA